ncbi:MAG: molybdopterin-dependent oxidoreductase [Deltaproteobacteria bacterium]|nr:molybdopterin-dependent oxidoreductase [Deltaproteobacteria bacterium]
MNTLFTRRGFLKTAGIITAGVTLGRFDDLVASENKPIIFPEKKKDLILLTSRPPQLETPLPYFKELITPNDALFVRWHLANIPTSVDLNQWKLKVNGNVDEELTLSMDDLKNKFEKATYTAVIQCSGNGRSFFEPRVPGGQWKNGAMGNVTWGGVRLKDILAGAGIKGGSVEIAFDGLDTGPLPSVPDFIKSLSVDKALEDDIIIAYEMNGGRLTMLNGFPVRLIVPGWYATYWVKALDTITVQPKQFDGFWMKTAYRIPDNACACIPGGSKPQKTVPINRMNVRSLIIDPADGQKIKTNKPTEIMGLAFSGGYSIKDVLVSVDEGRTWKEARLGQDKGRYSWVQWFYPWRPAKPGRYTIMARAVNSIGESQPMESLWNPAGFMRNKIEKIEVNVG